MACVIYTRALRSLRADATPPIGPFARVAGHVFALSPWSLWLIGCRLLFVVLSTFWPAPEYQKNSTFWLIGCRLLFVALSGIIVTLHMLLAE
jgi:hypothetical protein